MSWTAHITGANEVSPALLSAVKEGTRAGLEKIGVDGARMVQENIKTPYNGRPPAVFKGNLAASIVSTFVSEPGLMGIVIGVAPTLGADVYAAPVETGARPHMPPVSALLPWVQMKFGAKDEKTALSLAWAVAMSIRKKGTQGHEMFSRALEELEQIAPDVLEKSILSAAESQGFAVGGGLA